MSKVSGITSHPFICADSYTQKYFEIATDGSIVCEKKFDDYCFDIWLLPDGNILTCFYGNGSGFRIMDRKFNVIREYRSGEQTNELFGCLPLKNGDVILGDLRQKCLSRIDSKGHEVSRTPLSYDGDNPHEIMRMPRLTRNGKEFLIVQPGIKKIRKYSPEGNITWEAGTHADTFTAIEEPNGNILYSSIEGIFEIDCNGAEVWSVLPSDITDIGFKWALGMQLLANGNIVVCNWLGHGHEGEGTPVFEITRDKKIVWKCDVGDIAPNLSNFQLTDTDSTDVCFTPLR